MSRNVTSNSFVSKYAGPTTNPNHTNCRVLTGGYFRIGDGIYVFSAWGKQSNWYKNLIACPRFAQVYVQIGLRRFHVRPEVVQDPQELKRIIHQLIRDDPEGAHTLMGWEPSRDDVESADFLLMIEKVLTLRFRERVEP